MAFTRDVCNVQSPRYDVLRSAGRPHGQSSVARFPKILWTTPPDSTAAFAPVSIRMESPCYTRAHETEFPW
jgi:hypothetical protein